MLSDACVNHLPEIIFGNGVYLRAYFYIWDSYSHAFLQELIL
jgi:hypothetical protein